jgi:Ca2+/Na+ antiporter
MKNFIIKIALISLALTLTGWMVFSQFIPQYYLPVLPFLLLIFIVVTIAVHAFQMQQAKKDMAKFTRNNMLVTFFKLIFYLTIAVTYIAFDANNAKVFVICFMLLYLIFTVSEVTSLVKETSANKNNDKSKN